MTDEATAVVTETIPASAGQISANAAFIFFDVASFYGLFNGIAQITSEANSLIARGPEGKVAVDRVVSAHLRCSLPALRSLRDAADRILLMSEQPPPGPGN